jgi:hypothetical protein
MSKIHSPSPENPLGLVNMSKIHSENPLISGSQDYAPMNTRRSKIPLGPQALASDAMKRWLPGIKSSDARRASGGRAKIAASPSHLSGNKLMEPKNSLK